VLLQQRRGDLLGDIAFDSLLDNRRLQLSPGHQDNAFGFQDGADAHRYRKAGHLRNILEVMGVGDPGGVIQRNEAGAGIDAASRLIEPDVPIVADAQDLQIDTTGLFDHLLVLQATLLDLFLLPLPIGDMAVGRIDIHFVEQLLLHKAVVALQRIVIDGVVFVKIEGDHVLEAQLLLPVQPYQFGIQRFWRRTRSQTQDGLLSLCLFITDQFCNLFSDKTGAFFQSAENSYGDFLERIYHAHSLVF
jgi:hypothetical protein